MPGFDPDADAASALPARSRRPVATAALLTCAALSALVLSGCGGGGSETAAASLPRLPGADAVPARPAPPIELTDYHGHRVDLAQLRGKPVLVAFLYTHCHDLCPIVAAKVHTAYAHLDPAQRPLFLAVSVDPAHDTAASAAAFNRRHRTVGEIDWLLGSRQELEKVWEAWSVKPEHSRAAPEQIEHSAEIFAVDPQGRIRALYPPEFKPALLAAGAQRLAGL
ncbi:MAG: SCO family protein [Actinobacteria bacterium]|nr:SCO family protein [Actinomycetota bacterium]